MRRAAAIFTALLLLICMTTVVSAASGATAAEAHATVTADGGCQVTLRLTVHLDSPVEKLVFPIPAGARSITVNGSSPSTSRNGDVLELNLSRIVGSVAGDFTVSISYELVGLVDYDDSGNLVLELPLLSGFAYPIENLSFSITLPGEITGKPVFTSIYYQTLIAQNLNYTVSGTQIVGNTTARIMDSDRLTLTLPVTEEMFPQEKPIVWSMGLTEVLMIVFAVLAVVYWLVFLRCLPPRRLYCTTAPDGIGAGEVATALTMGKSDLTMLVVHWAQLGYILIHMDDNGRVFLHKRMNMGNERSAYENRIFKHLFGKRKLVDGTGLHYAQLCRKVAAGKPGLYGLYQGGSGNPNLFRLLCAIIGLLGGVSIGSALGKDSLFEGLLVLVLAVLGLVSAWVIQEGGKCLHLRSKLPLWVGLGISGVWLVLGSLAGELNVAACVVAAELFAGIAAAYGGRRTELGKQAISQTLGLRRYLKSVPKEQLQKILRANPDYYFSLVPYALALGVDRQFSKRFGGLRLPACPYLTTGMDGHMTAAEWDRLLRDVVRALDERQQQLFWERLTGR